MNTGLLSHDIPAMWAGLLPFFEEFERLAEGDPTAQQLKHDCEAGLRQCWVHLDGGIKAVTLTALRNDMVVIEFCAGDRMEQWRDEKLELIKRWGRHNGATRWRVYGRKGWARTFPELRETARILTGDL